MTLLLDCDSFSDNERYKNNEAGVRTVSEQVTFKGWCTTCCESSFEMVQMLSWEQEEDETIV